MPNGFLTMFEDPVVGPQLALGLLSLGTGLLTSRPKDVPDVIQGGIGQIGQGLLYGGVAKAKRDQQERELASRRASAAAFDQFLGGSPTNGETSPASGPIPGTAPLTSPYVLAPGQASQPSPTAQAQTATSMGRISPEAAFLIKQSILNPDIKVGPAITQLLQPTEMEKIQQGITAAGLSPEQGQEVVRRNIGYLPKIGDELSMGALAKYREQKLAMQQAAQEAINADRDASRALSDADRNAALALQERKLSGPGRTSAFQQKMQDLGYSPGSPEYLKAARIAAGLEPRASNATPIYNEKGEVVSYLGGPGKPFTESQQKAITNVTLAEAANRDMEQLRKEGFDPTSITGGSNVALASSENPIANLMASEEGQRQNTANQAFAQSVNYQRSGAATPELEYNRAVQSVIERIGDKPEVAEGKRRYRTAIVEAIKSGDGRIDTVVQEILSKQYEESQGRAPAPSPGGENGETAEELFKRLSGR